MKPETSAIHTVTLSLLAYGATVGAAEILGLIRLINKSIHAVGPMADYPVIFFALLLPLALLLGSNLRKIRERKIASFIVGSFAGHILGVLAYFGSHLSSVSGRAGLMNAVERSELIFIFLAANMLSAVLFSSIIAAMLLAMILLIAYVKDKYYSGRSRSSQAYR